MGMEAVVQLCAEVIAPLIKVDGGELYVVSVSDDVVHLHLAGSFAGSPGAPVVREFIIAPAFARALPSVIVQVTSGVDIPESAVRVEPK